jgi:hypothetical protein
MLIFGHPEYLFDPEMTVKRLRIHNWGKRQITYKPRQNRDGMCVVRFCTYSISYVRMLGVISSQIMPSLITEISG